jgi:hypothetical protein
MSSDSFVNAVAAEEEARGTVLREADCEGSPVSEDVTRCSTNNGRIFQDENVPREIYR